MKNYFAPKVEIITTDEQDIVRTSSIIPGVSIGNGGTDINNWYWNADPASAERTNLPS